MVDGFIHRVGEHKRFSRKAAETQREERLIEDNSPYRVRGFPMCGKYRKKGTGRDVPANMGRPVAGRDERPRSSATDWMAGGE